MSQFHFTIQRNQPAQLDRWPARAPHWIIRDKDGFPVKDVHDVTIGQALEQLQAQIASLTAENERLRALVKEAQIAGWLAADSYGISDYEYQQIWEKSRARAALQPKEGNQ